MSVNSVIFQQKPVKTQPLTTERSLVLLSLPLLPGQFLLDRQNQPWFPLYAEGEHYWYLAPSRDLAPNSWRLAGSVMQLPAGQLLLSSRADALWLVLHALFYWPTRRQDCRVLAELPEHCPIDLQPSRMLWPCLPAGVIASLAVLDDWRIPARFTADRPGCFDGDLSELMARCQQTQPELIVVEFSASTCIVTTRNETE
jgi:hypothetical protein